MAERTTTLTLPFGFEAVGANTLAHIGQHPRLSTPATFNQGSTPRGGLAVDFPWAAYKNFSLHTTCVYGLTGGASGVLNLMLQRKINHNLPDTDALAWEDFCWWTYSAADAVGSLRKTGEAVGLTKDGNLNFDYLAYVIVRDLAAANSVRGGHPGEYCRLRTSVTGDRTGGTATITLNITGHEN